jgi:hypothetical protein
MLLLSQRKGVGNDHVDDVNCSRGIHQYHVGLAHERDLESRLEPISKELCR